MGEENVVGAPTSQAAPGMSKPGKKKPSLSTPQSVTLKNAAIGALAGAAGAVFAKTIFEGLPTLPPPATGVPTGAPTVQELLGEITPEEQTEVLRHLLGDGLLQTLASRVSRRRAQRRLTPKEQEAGDVLQPGVFGKNLFGGGEF